jgi:hypothetical protein
MPRRSTTLDNNSVLNPALVEQKLFSSLVARYVRRQTDGELAALQDIAGD